MSELMGSVKKWNLYPPLQRWERSFRAAAHSDNYALFRDHMRRLGLPVEPKLMLEGTIELVSSCLNFDGRRDRHILELQRYDPSQATGARYAFTFDLCGKSCARVLLGSNLRRIDLADLFEYPWEDYKVVGYDRIWISHPDWSHLTNEELQQLEDHVTNDLLFDYGEDELSFWFEAGPDNSFLLVNVVEIWTVEEEDAD